MLIGFDLGTTPSNLTVPLTVAPRVLADPEVGPAWTFCRVEAQMISVKASVRAIRDFTEFTWATLARRFYRNFPARVRGEINL